MSQKRSRATYEADLRSTEPSFVVFGTPIPEDSLSTRDDGLYVPVHKQEVRDDQGRRRFHGAFTGGWSAGYFNTVGTKEGWTPSEFISSRSSRKTDKESTLRRRPEDYMDEEDLADAAEAEEIQTRDAFAGLGARAHDRDRGTPLGEVKWSLGGTMGTSLMNKMGWKPGQGIGPKIRRAARLHDQQSAHNWAASTHMFAPDDVPLSQIIRKLDRNGLGCFKDASMGREKPGRRSQTALNLGKEDGRLSTSLRQTKQDQSHRSGTGLSISQDVDLDEDDDAFALGPRVFYNKSSRNDKPKKKGAATKPSVVNPTLDNKPSYVARRSGFAPWGRARHCADGLPPLPGFILASDPYPGRGVSINVLPVPSDWTSSKYYNKPSTQSELVDTPPKSGSAKHDPQTRAIVLGELPLPGKSVFDFMSTQARERVMAASGKTDLPLAKGEMPSNYASLAEQSLSEMVGRLPQLEKDTALAAISRGAGTRGPYADDAMKQHRYRMYLEFAAGLRSTLSPKPTSMTVEEFSRELTEFYGCARLFKPMTGIMATRFTTSSVASAVLNNNGPTENIPALVSIPQPRDPSEEAARLGMYGNLTRSVQDFYPAKLLCKRMNIQPPRNGHSKVDLDNVPTEQSVPTSVPEITNDVRTAAREQAAGSPMVDSGYTEAVAVKIQEGIRPAEDLFKAVFGDSDDENA